MSVTDLIETAFPLHKNTCQFCASADMMGYIDKKAHCRLDKEIIILDTNEKCQYKVKHGDDLPSDAS